jgi:hypothetical protein
MTTTATETAPPLTASDRCDRCGAAAQIRFVMRSGNDVLLCKHHGDKHEVALVEQGASIAEDTRALLPTA